MDGECDAGGIRSLLDLIDEHRAALEYDWRTRFHIGLDEVPARMSYGEACRQVVTLAGDPSTQFSVSLHGMKFPVTREWLAIADLIDITAGDKKWHYPRPLDEKPKSPPRQGNARGRDPQEVVALLRAAATGTAETASDETTREW